jgi:integrase
MIHTKAGTNVPKKREKEEIRGAYFKWLLGVRNAVYYADGRSNKPNLGRHSLGTRERSEAIEQVRRLDLAKAVELGHADRNLLRDDHEQLLPLEEGRQRYVEYVSRPLVQGGGSRSTQKRYRPVLDKFLAFARKQGIRFWQQVNKELLTRYAKWLDDEDYKYATEYLELTTLKQVIKWLVGEGLLQPNCLITLKLRKPQGTATYCYSASEVQAIVEFCRKRPDLPWLAGVVIALAHTGLRIGELAGLRWADIDRERSNLHLSDTTQLSSKSQRHEARTTKSHRDRTLPIHPELRRVLEGLPRYSDGRVFHGPEGGRLKPDTVRNVFRREVLSKLADRFPAGDNGPGIMAGRLHSFRHFFCSMAADINVSEQLLMNWLGHRESKMIRHYYHSRQDEGRKQIARLNILDNHREPRVESQ